MQVLESKPRVKKLDPPSGLTDLRADPLSPPVKKPTPIYAPKRGRPPGHDTNDSRKVAEVLEKKSSTKTTFPRPPGGNYMKSFPAFLKYWKALTPAMLSRCKVHVYRVWPAINPTLLAGVKTRTIDMFEEDPVKSTTCECPFDDTEYKQQLLHRYGSGDYRMILNEIGVSGSVAECRHIQVRDDMIPPRVDPATLIMGDPINEGYCRELRQRGIKLPGDPDYKEKEDDDMSAAATTIDKLLEQNATLTNRVLTANQTPHLLPQRDPASLAESKGIDVITRSAELAGNIVERAQERAAQLSSNQVNPLAMLESLAGVAEKLGGGTKGPDPIIAMLMQQNADLQKEMRAQAERNAEKERQERQRDEERRARDEERRAADQRLQLELLKPKSLVEQLEEQRKVNELLGIKKPRGIADDDGDEDKPSGKTDWSQMILTNLPLIATTVTTLFSLGANIVHNARLAPGTAPEPVPTGGMQATQQAAQQAISGATAEQNAQQAQVHAFLQTIEGPFLTHFFSTELNGYTFADAIYHSDMTNGPIIYAQMKAQEREAMISALSSYPPIWTKIQSMPAQLQQFVNEFMNYEDWKAGAMDEEDTIDTTPIVEPEAVN